MSTYRHETPDPFRRPLPTHREGLDLIAKAICALADAIYQVNLAMTVHHATKKKASRRNHRPEAK